MMTVILQHHAATLTSVGRTAQLERRMTIATRTVFVLPVVQESTLPAVSFHTRGVWCAQQEQSMMILMVGHRVRFASRASMRKQAALEHALGVLLAALLQLQVARALMPVTSVKQGSTQARALPCVPSAHLAVLTRTRTLPHRALSVQVARMLAAARQCATSVFLVRSTVMKTLRLPARPAWLDSTGWDGVRRRSVHASSAVQDALIWTLTALQTVPTVIPGVTAPLVLHP